MWLAAPSTSAVSSSCLLQSNPPATQWHLLVPSWRSQLPSCSQPLAPAFSPSVSPQLQVDLAGGRSGNWHGVRIDLRVLLYLPAIGCGNQREKVSEPWRELVCFALTWRSSVPAGPAEWSSSSPLSSSPQDTTTEVRKRARRSGRKTSTSSSFPCGPALHAIDHVGHLGPLGTGLGALEQEQGMGQLTAALRWLQTCAFPVESGGGRWNSESP